VSATQPVVSDSSPLIALERVGRLELVRDLFEQLIVPPAVAKEVFGAEPPPPWLEVVSPSLNASVPGNLGAGERETIALALQLGARAVILDDLPARRLAAARGLPVMGTVALLLAAKRTGRLAAVAPVLDELLTAGFRLSDDVLSAALRAAGER